MILRFIVCRELVRKILQGGLKVKTRYRLALLLLAGFLSAPIFAVAQHRCFFNPWQ